MPCLSYFFLRMGFVFAISQAMLLAKVLPAFFVQRRPVAFALSHIEKSCQNRDSLACSIQADRRRIPRSPAQPESLRIARLRTNNYFQILVFIYFHEQQHLQTILCAQPNYN